MFCGESELWMYLQYSSAGGERNYTYCWILIDHRYLLIEEPGNNQIFFYKIISDISRM